MCLYYTQTSNNHLHLFKRDQVTDSVKTQKQNEWMKVEIKIVQGVNLHEANATQFKAQHLGVFWSWITQLSMRM